MPVKRTPIQKKVAASNAEKTGHDSETSGSEKDTDAYVHLPQSTVMQVSDSASVRVVLPSSWEKIDVAT